MIKHTDPILIMGAGSIGERHISILQKLGFSNIWVYRQRNLPFRQIDVESVSSFTDRGKIVTIKPAAGIISTPTSQHLEQATFCLNHKIPVLIEKPLSHNLTGIGTLKAAVRQNKTYAQVAYMLRYHPYFNKIKTTIRTGALGKLMHMEFFWGEYLPDWHPWEDYRNSYAGRKELGGGAALTLSHDIDLSNWFTDSSIEHWEIRKNFVSMPELDVESAAGISITYRNGVSAHCYLGFQDQVPRRSYHFLFEQGRIEMDYYKSELITYSSKNTTIQSLPDFDRNQLYEAQILDFFEQTCKRNSITKALNSIEESEVIITICQ